MCPNVPLADDGTCPCLYLCLNYLQAKQYLETENVKELAEKGLEYKCDACSAYQCALLVAALCVRQSAVWQPSMNQVW